MKVAITGSGGRVGQALAAQLDPERFEITPFDLPDHDATNLGDLIASTQGHDVLVHLAWKGLNVNSVDPLNGVMYENAYKAAVANKIGLVVMGSSNHAHAHDERDSEGRISYTGTVETANNIYGVEKQKMEAMGKFFAKREGLSVLALRIGNINAEDKPRPNDHPSRWLSHRDFGHLITLAIDAKFEPGHFEVVYGVSKQPVFDWSNSFGYEPQDSAE